MLFEPQLYHNLVPHGKSVTIGKCEGLVVVQNGVEVLNPVRVHWPVENQPEVVRLLPFHALPPECGEDAIAPVVGGNVQPPEHLSGSDRLWIQPHLLVWLPCQGHPLHQQGDARGLASPTGSQDHDPVTHTLCLKQLDELDGPWRVVDQVLLRDLVLDGVLQLGIASLLQQHVWEEIVDQGHEERLVLIDQLGEVHVPEDPHHDGCLCVLWCGALCGTQSAENGEDVPQAKVVVDLLGQLLLAPFYINLGNRNLF